MALSIHTIDLAVEGTQSVRRGVGYVYALDVSNRKAGGLTDSVTSATIELVLQRTEGDVLNSFFASTTTTYSDQTITLPEMTVPAGAEKGEYVLTVEYEAGGFSPDRLAIKFTVTD